MIKVSCPTCGKKLNLPDQFAGKKGKCPGCQEMLTIPAASAEAAKVAPPPVQPRKPTPPPVVEEVEEVGAEEVEEPEEMEEVEEVEAITEKPGKRAKGRPAPPDEDEDEERVARTPTKKRPPPVADEEDDDRPRRKMRKITKGAGDWAECPNCGAADATRVHWTLWGGMIGPALINTVRCNDCGKHYNGVHGDYNTVRIAIYMIVTLVLAVGLSVVAIIVGYDKLNP